MKHGSFSGKVDPFARAKRPTRMAPRREPGEHDKDGKKEGPTQADLDAALQLATENETKANTAVWIAAENQWKLDQKNEATKTDDEKKFDAAVKAAADTAVAAQIATARQGDLDKIAALQLASVDSAITSALVTAQIDPKKVEGVLAKLDKKSFLGEDGTVKAEDVKTLVAGMSSTTTSRPPRTGGLANPNDRSIARYATKNLNP